MNIVAEYWSLTKAGLVAGNLITVLAGFAIGARATDGRGGAALLVATVAGIALVMASGCVFNNCIDRRLDAHMKRTKDRALVLDRVSLGGALVFGTVLGVAGFVLLSVWAGPASLAAAIAGFFFYVVAYSLWAKRRTVYGTAVGAIAGSTPPIVGYAAATGRIDLTALVLFLMLMTWQMAHFFAIAIRRNDDYAAAGVPVMSVKYGIARTKASIIVYVVEFAVAASLLTVFGIEGYGYLALVVVLSLLWLGFAVRGFRTGGESGDRAWARQMFLFSLVVMVAVFAAAAFFAV